MNKYLKVAERRPCVKWRILAHILTVPILISSFAVTRSTAQIASLSQPSAQSPSPPQSATQVAAQSDSSAQVDTTSPPSTQVTTQSPVNAGDSQARLEGSVKLGHEQTPFACNEEPDPLTEKGRKKSALSSTVGATKSLANFMLDLRGFDYSKEAANAISDTNVNSKNELAREYLAQKKHNEQELLKAALIMQMSMCMDRDPKKTSAALVQMEKLIGTAESVDIYSVLKKMDRNSLSVDDDRLKLDFVQKRAAVGKLLEIAASRDPVLVDVSHRLSKYNHRGKLIQITAKVVYSTLGIASFAPTLVAPIAETALLSFMMATGGPEQDKLLKEVYLAKILQNRCDMLNEKAHLATESLDIAVMTKNKRLLACTKALIKDLADEKAATSIVGPFDTPM